MGADGPSEAGVVRVAGLGCAEVAVGSTKLLPSAARAFLVALYLADQRGRRVGRDALAAQVWPGESLQRQRHNLRQVLYTLRRAGMPLVEANATVMLRPRDVSVDWESALTLDVDDAVRRFREPADVRVLPGYQPTRSPALQEWLDEMRGRAEARLQRRLVQLVVLARREGRWEQAERLAYACLAIDPLNEEATLTVAEAAALSGSKTKALKLLDRYLEELGDEAKDLRLPAETLRRRIAERVSGPRPAMPARTKLVGRADLMGALTAALHDAKAGRGSAHLLYGPAGIGKTRLLDEVADTAVLLGGFSVVRVDVVASGADLEVRLGSLLAQRALALPGALGADPSLVQYCKLLSGAAPLQNEPMLSLSTAVADHGAVGAATALLQASSEERPAVIVADAFSGSDERFLTYLEPLARACRNAALLVLATWSAPPTEPTPLWQTTSVPPLEPDAALQLFGVVAGLSEIPSDCTPLVQRARGHPLFISALARDFRASIRSKPARSLSALVTRQLLALTAQARRTLELLACAEEAVHPSVLALALDLPDDSVRTAISQLLSDGLISGSFAKALHVHDLVKPRVLEAMSPSEVTSAREALAAALARLPAAATPTGIAQVYRLLNNPCGSDAAFASGIQWADALIRTGQVAAALSICADMQSPKDPQLRRRLSELIVSAAFTDPSAPLIRRLLDQVAKDDSQSALHSAVTVAELFVDWADRINPEWHIERCKALLATVTNCSLRRKLVYHLLVTASHARHDADMAFALSAAERYLDSLTWHEADDCEIEALRAFYTARLQTAYRWARLHVDRLVGATPARVARALAQLGTIESHCDQIDECLATMTRARNISLQVGVPRMFLVSTVVLLKIHTSFRSSYADAVHLAEESLSCWMVAAEEAGVLRRYLRAERAIVDALVGPVEILPGAIDELLSCCDCGLAAAGRQEVAAAALWAALRMENAVAATTAHTTLCSLIGQTYHLLSDIAVAALSWYRWTLGDRASARRLLSVWSERWPGRLGTTQIQYVKALVAQD